MSHYRRHHHTTCRSLTISSNEEQLALSLAGGPAFTLALNNQELMKADDMNFELLGPGVHTAGVHTSVVCICLCVLLGC